MLTSDSSSETRDSYQWLVSAGKYVSDLLAGVPEIVVGQYVAVTSLDSGEMRLSSDEMTRGWSNSGGISYSPKIKTPEDLPYQSNGPDAAGFDEYYVFKTPAQIGKVLRRDIFTANKEQDYVIPFVNIFAFNLGDLSKEAAHISELFWSQLLRLQPESYLADAKQCLTVVTKNKTLFGRARVVLVDR